jgi:signal transduction histidine kinase
MTRADALDRVAARDPSDGPGRSGELTRHQTEVLELIASGTPLAAVLAAVTRALEDLIPGSRCSVLLLDRERGVLVHGAAPSLPQAYTEAIDGMAIGPEAGSCGTAAHLGRPVVASDIDSDPRWRGFRDVARPHGMRSCWSTPIRGLAGILGTFAVYHDEPHGPDEDEERLLGRFTHLASIAIEHAELFGALAESEERFRRAFEDNSIGMALTRPDGTLVKANRALTDLLERGEAALLGSNLADWISRESSDPDGPEDDLGTGVVGALCAVASGDRDVVHVPARTPRDGPRRAELEVTASGVRGRDQRVAMICVNVLDVTLQRAAARERRARHEADLARAAAESASRAKSEFVSALSHELRTPLQAIMGFTELLGTLDLNPRRRATALAHISSAAAHVLSIVDDVLDLAKIEAGALPLHPEPVRLREIAREVADLLQTVAAAREVRVSVIGDAPEAIADPRRLRQVLINLVTNGVQYNRRGGWVEIRLTATAPGWATVAVADGGSGVDPLLIDRMFVSFDRLDADRPGTGLGMVLVKGLVERMSGRLAVRSEVDRGTVVTVELPCR